MSQLVDTIVVFRILRKLTTPWKKTKAYELGIIDEKGKVLIKTRKLTAAQKKHYTTLDRLVFNLKRILEKVPGGKTQFGSYLAAISLLKEYVEDQSNKETSKVLMEKLEEHNYIPKQTHDLSTVEGFLDAWEESLIEGMVSGASFGGAMSGAGSNTTVNSTGLAGVDQPLQKKKRKNRIEKIINKRL